MKPLEIYRLLPGTNCGQCPAKSCMAFAVLLASRPDAVAECSRIIPENLEKLKAMLVAEDWRDELIEKLSEEVSSINFTEIASGLGASLKNGRLIVRCIGIDYEIEKGGGIMPDSGNKWINILLLHYIRSRGSGDFTGKWVSFSEFKGGMVKASSFKRECEEPLREMFDRNQESVLKILDRLGAAAAEGYSADFGRTLDLLPKVRAMLLYRKEDEEFPSSLKILFDSITGRFLDVESVMFLCEGLVHTINGLLGGRA